MERFAATDPFVTAGLALYELDSPTAGVPAVLRTLAEHGIEATVPQPQPQPQQAQQNRRPHDARRHAMYELDILFQGFPGRSTCHGGLGWSTVALLRGHGETVLVDTGGYGYRAPLLAQLEERGIRRPDVTAVVLTTATGTTFATSRCSPRPVSSSRGRIWSGPRPSRSAPGSYPSSTSRG
jgi:hypothetical protein